MGVKVSGSLIGRIAVQLGLLSMEQLAAATREQGRQPSKRLGEIFVEKGFLTPAKLSKLQQVQRDLLIKHRAAQALRADQREERPPAAAQPEAPQGSAPARTNASLPTLPGTSAPGPGGARSQTRSATAAMPPASAGATLENLELRLPKASEADRERLHGILRELVSRGGSDVHLHGGAAMRFRLNGRLEEIGPEEIDPETGARLVAAALEPDQREALERCGELDLCYAAPGIGRFRANVYRQHRGFDAVFRSIPAEPPTLEELGLPSALARFTNFHQGMVLVTGPAGCGKSSTMAALVNLINEEREEHILTIEDPIEVVHPSKRCLVNQRHAGQHTRSFARALRAALREDPDVIVIGELRDLETISLALTAAETGHFVLATLHTNSAVRTVGRMIGAFPSNRQDQVRTMLSVSLRAVLSQRLVARADGEGRVPALEVLTINKAIGNLIREQKTTQIRSSIQTGRNHGMMLLEQSLKELVQAGTISQEEALRHAEDAKLITG